MPDDGFSLKPKHVASNKTNIHSVVVDGLYCPCAVYISQLDVTDKETLMVIVTLHYLAKVLYTKRDEAIRMCRRIRNGSS